MFHRWEELDFPFLLGGDVWHNRSKNKFQFSPAENRSSYVSESFETEMAPLKPIQKISLV
jgi:hypothetical protein